MQKNLKEIVKFRLDKLQSIKDKDINPYPYNYSVDTRIIDIINDSKTYIDQSVKIAGRIISLRKMGKSTFLNIQDMYGKIQLYIKNINLKDELYDNLVRKLDMGDIVGIEGKIFFTKTNELSINVNDLTLLSKSIRPLPNMKEKDGKIFFACPHTEINHEAGENSTLTKEKGLYSFPLYPLYTGFFRTHNPHVRIWLTAMDVWKKNKIFGNGIRSFREDCIKLVGSAIYPEAGYNLAPDTKLFKRNRLCSNHPHNYYVEILTETGIVGLFVTLTIALLFIVFILKNFKLFKGNNIENFILLAATISLILEVFPFKTSGSVFTTNDAAYIILIASIILSHKKRQIVSKRTTNAKKF